MKTIIVYDSYFGNTKTVAEEIKKNLKGDTEIVFVDDFKDNMLNNIELLIVGSPTRAFNSTGKINKFIKSLDKLKIKNIDAIAFDTRVDVEKINSKFLIFMAKHFGYASEKIEKKLKKLGANIRVPNKGFYVTGEKGPLCKGETEEIKKWLSVYKK